MNASDFLAELLREDGTRKAVSCYGSVKSTGDMPEVQLDGASETIPCWKTVDVLPEDRVLVQMSPDGRPVIVGNFTKPATDDEFAVNAFGKLVRQVDEIRADTGRFDDLFANEADVYVLVADNATVAQLEAADAQIAALEAQDLAVVKVTATDATIALLKADSADVTELNAACITVTRETVEDLNADIATIHDLRADVARIQTLKADKAEIEDLSAAAAAIQQLDVSSLNAQAADVAKLKATSMHADFATFDAAELDAAKIASLFAASGWFEQVTVTGDATITGRIKGVLLDGDTARFQNIYADALKLLGPDGLYHALNFQGLSEALETVYEQVEPDGTEDPSAEGWFERSGEEGSYVYGLSEDAAVDSGKDYYAASQRLADANARALVDNYGEALDNGLHGSHIIAESVTATQLDATSVRAALLEVLNLTVGYSGATHIDMSGDRMSFKKGTQEVAYIAVDEHGDSTFYMTRSVVVKDLKFGKWMWFERSNRNMALKWVG